jgi:hypothetical protein
MVHSTHPDPPYGTVTKTQTLEEQAERIAELEQRVEELTTPRLSRRCS